MESLPKIILLVMSIAICNTCFGGTAYLAQQERLINSLQETNADKKFFIHSNTYPPGSKTHDQSLYGFKVSAISEALFAGFQKIIWLDTACIVHGPLEYLFEEDMPPVVAVKDDTPLIKTISDKALKYYGNPDITGRHLIGGSLYAFDFTKDKCIQIYDDWGNAEDDGIFGTAKEQASEQINKHRHDESCLSMALYDNGIEPVSHEKARYCNGENSIVAKKHFK
jgi:hypothetical protein